jgi:hypothetical protein
LWFGQRGRLSLWYKSINILQQDQIGKWDSVIFKLREIISYKCWYDKF